MDPKVYLLSINDEWRERYDDLVKSGVISDGIFWTDKQVSLNAARAYLEQQQEQDPNRKTPQQKAAAILRQIHGMTDGRGEFKFRLTADIIKSIYENLPLVKQLHVARVKPGDLTEKDFWTQFCSSRTFGKELGVGEDMPATPDNIFDAAFKNRLPDSDGEDDEGSMRISKIVNVSLNDENEYYERTTKKETLKALRQLNSYSMHALGDSHSNWSIESETDLSDLHSVAISEPSRMEDADSCAEVAKESHESIDLSRAKFDSDWFSKRLLSFPQTNEILCGPDLHSAFTTISPADFTDSHYESIRSLHVNSAHLLRIFWHSLPLTSREKYSSAQAIIGALKSTHGRFTDTISEWPEKEVHLCSALLMPIRSCMEKSIDKFDSYPTLSKRTK